ETGLLEKKLDRMEAALALFTDLAASPNPYQVAAFEELAKFYEHQERNYAMALEMTISALGIEDSPQVRRREGRLRGKMAAPKSRRLL
ncbi:MAG: hypothetical protein ABIZ80_13975, partial [Bryobacteraceae bacterium]